ncbi:hypothetical protein B0T20DRAFT_354161 [Sordaria brevicollis]|uniref:Uncharacterized protein n=1 Tax=Sordaria brevicollis TaxID=83679 RepID=A0AAE0PCQ2_SORBR|nr:hypothetical protein B0T20DRAFT_354161 [Sordaria brevicollis]
MGRGKKRNRPTKEVVERWKHYFGEGNLEDWQRLCKDLGFDDVFSSKTKCREALKSINVNIWDFLDAVDEGRLPHMFPTKQELVRHTWSTGRVFPKSEAKNMGPVAALLKMLR